jgi:carbon-monoxide dehydrogenase medium subunit
MMPDAQRQFIAATSMSEALAARRQGASVVAGGTWMMRDERRGVEIPTSVVSLHGIPALTRVEIGSDSITIGALVSHSECVRALRGLAGFEGVVAAAGSAANPGIRHVATVGGNLCTIDFPAADLVPAFLACDATVEIETGDGPIRVSMPEFVKDRPTLLSDGILTRVHLRRDLTASAHMRLPLRKAGDYPVAIVSLARDAGGGCRVAVGSVEKVSRRWTALEHAFAKEPGGFPQDAARATALAVEHNDFEGRDGTEAQGWYRRQVLAPLVGRAVASLLSAQVSA